MKENESGHYSRDKLSQNILEKLIRIENSTLFDLRDQVNLVFVLIGAKPATSLWEGYAEKHDDDFKRNFRKKKYFIKELNLHARFRINDEGEDIISSTINVGHSKQNVKKFSNRPHSQFGRTIGFPRSAVRAYNNDTGLREIPEELLQLPEIMFLDFTPSSEKVQKEFQYVRSRAQILKMISPYLYDKMMNPDLAEAHRNSFRNKA